MDYCWSGSCLNHIEHSNRKICNQKSLIELKQERRGEDEKEFRNSDGGIAHTTRKVRKTSQNLRLRTNF